MTALNLYTNNGSQSWTGLYVFDVISVAFAGLNMGNMFSKAAMVCSRHIDLIDGKLSRIVCYEIGYGAMPQLIVSFYALSRASADHDPMEKFVLILTAVIATISLCRGIANITFLSFCELENDFDKVGLFFTKLVSAFSKVLAFTYTSIPLWFYLFVFRLVPNGIVFSALHWKFLSEKPVWKRIDRIIASLYGLMLTWVCSSDVLSNFCYLLLMTLENCILIFYKPDETQVNDGWANASFALNISFNLLQFLIFAIYLLSKKFRQSRWNEETVVELTGST